MPWKTDLISKNNFEYKSNDYNVNVRASSPLSPRPWREFVLRKVPHFRLTCIVEKLLILLLFLYAIELVSAG